MRLCSIAAIILGLLLVRTGSSQEAVLNRPVPQLLTGEPLRRALDGQAAALWSEVPLRRVVRRMTEEWRIAILLDRRFDPTQPMQVNLAQISLRDALERIAGQARGRAAIVSNTAYIGPPLAAAHLRTLIALRHQELEAMRSRVQRAHYLALFARRTLAWNDLDAPQDILANIGERYRLKIENLDAVPHDLWAAAVLPEANAMEALQLVLSQFDLTFSWSENAESIRLHPIPETVAIEKIYTGLRPSAAAVQDVWKQQFPDLQTELRNGDLAVLARVEQHEALDELLNPRRMSVPKPSDPPVPLDRRRFTLTLENKPAAALFQALKRYDIVVSYDEDELKAANIDSTRLISVAVENATIEELMQAVCDQLKLTFQIDGFTITLAPRSG